MASVAKAKALLAETEHAQAIASDPTISAWVSANAGAGKTHVLKLRVLRLLLAGTAPERILCLTYTKAAAAEMAQRIFKDLSDWTTSDDATLSATITRLVGQPPANSDLRTARQLFARAIETPGGLKIQTIHAFCERLLQRFPLEAGVAPAFSILDDETGSALRAEAINRTLGEANADTAGELAAALNTAVMYAADERFDELLAAALAKRAWLEDVSRLPLVRGGRAYEKLEAYYRQLFDVSPDATAAGILAEIGALLTDAELRAAIAALATGGKNDLKLADRLGKALATSEPLERLAAFSEAFLTGKGEPRADRGFLSKAVSAAEPAVATKLANARDRLYVLAQRRRSLQVVAATLALIRLADRVMQHYAEAKARRAALDFDDLIVRTSNLLSSSSAADWVLYKLDGGIDHILVDEAQDTSPLQWTIIESLASEFFAGEGAGAGGRTLFAVGDEKQSIYSFQGAAPKRFAQAGRQFGERAREADRAWSAVPLTLSFRTVGPLLDSIDSIFADPGRTPGLTASDAAIRHQAIRLGQAGRVEVWPTIVPAETAPTPAFAPLEETSTAAPVRLLAERIAEQIDTWLSGGEMLTSQGRVLAAGDILILVRRRQPFAPEMVRALKTRGIPVAGSDRIVLSEQIAVQDLMALGDFLVLPEDDLALATVLKSPLFDLDDMDLMAIAPQRKGSLWSALIAAPETNERTQSAVATLKRWRALADFAPPYEFFATLLDRDNCRKRLLRRLGPDAADPIDEFMQLALTYDDQAPASLQGFLSWLRDDERQIKRDMEQGRNEVRVMTVHGAKGLEAPVVMLPDTCSPARGGRVPSVVDLAAAEMAGLQSSPHVWAVKGSRSLPPIAASDAVARQLALEEHNRLLYVALTRARDRIYVCGYETKRGRGAGCWYDTIMAGLEETLEPATNSFGEEILVLDGPQTVDIEPSSSPVADDRPAQALPDWALRRAPSEPQRVMPMSPSRLVPLETDDDGEPAPFDVVRAGDGRPAEPASPSPRAMVAENRFLRGILTHALLEHLPQYDRAQRKDAAHQFIALRGKVLKERVRREIVKEALSVLDDPEFAAVFGQNSRAEVPIAAEIPNPAGIGPPLRLTGLIDRLLQRKNDVLIVDYKTNRPPPTDVTQVADAYVLQMAAYRVAVQQIFQTAAVRAAIIWTDGPRLMPIPDELLDLHQQRLWDLGSPSLDAT